MIYNFFFTYFSSPINMKMIIIIKLSVKYLLDYYKTLYYYYFKSENIIITYTYSFFLLFYRFHLK